ncbi:MAG: 3-keto-5-aminohexanoate cleavage protein [Propionicimonas sp.]|uniref:3-keto-5-aminohexanoate cleavage protein n=1 Tax=Propionicimonas sp. TaxID=1955623 RepID=UPI002B1FBB22|nr:3-keto-5-aminohexanoate cleavage protein [Propionicimonas sp.]MEA4944017.1 3-keto-5-aminohexanoate cleavage protein [Propionicimonas sp.]
MDLNNKVVLTAALTGAVTPKSINDAIPMTPEEISEDAYRVWQAGASVVHFHMRDDEGLGTMDKERFKQTMQLLRADHPDCDVVINFTTAGDNRATDDERLAHLPYVTPEIGTFDAGSFNWMPDGVFVNSPQFLERLGRTLSELNIKPEFEIFDAGQMYNVAHYAKAGILNSPLHYQFVLGVPGGMPADVESLIYLKNLLPADATWGAFGVGRDNQKIVYATLALGGHVRVGLEDNVYLSRGVKATNLQLVERAVRVIRDFGKDVATPDEARQILDIPSHEGMVNAA